MKESQDCLFELGQSGSCGDYAAPKPERYAQTEPTPIGNHDEVFHLINKTFAAFAVAVQSVVDFFDITPN